MRFCKRSGKREQDTFVTSAQTMVTFGLCCHKYCFKKLNFTSFFFIFGKLFFVQFVFREWSLACAAAGLFVSNSGFNRLCISADILFQIPLSRMDIYSRF